ncbi:alanine/glycine:cation symporter family protein [Planctomycetota bacterium]
MNAKKQWHTVIVTAAVLAALICGPAMARAQEGTADQEISPQTEQIPDKPDLKVFKVDISGNAMVLEYGVINEGSDFEGKFNVNIYYYKGKKEKDDQGNEIEPEYTFLYTDTIDTSDPKIDLSHKGTCYRSLKDVEWKWGWPEFHVKAVIDEEGVLDEADAANNSNASEWTYLELIPKRMGYFISFPLIIILLGTGLLITISNKFIQARKLGHSFKVVAGAYDDPKDEGDVTHFQALSAALSATVGIGNIAGVAIALRWGGPGALFWMWITAALGMSLKFAECSLAHRYRIIHEDGSASGGPMYYITQGLGKNWRWLAILFATCAVLCSFCTGNMNQANTIADSLREYDLSKIHFPGFLLDDENHIHSWIVGIVVASMVGVVVIGGIKRIATVASKIVPTMAILYCGGALIILVLNYDNIGSSLARIFKEAFVPEAAIGSAFMVIMWGIRRGLYSNEAGQGSAPMAHAAAKTDEPVREGIVALMEPFVDTLVICTITGVTILSTGALDNFPDLTGAPLTRQAFETGFGDAWWLGNAIVTISVFFFAYSTMISWSYYGDRACEYLFGAKAIKPYRFVYVFFNFLGCILPLAVVWNVGDVALSCMAIPNLVAVIFLSMVLKKMTDKYFSKKHLTYKELLTQQQGEKSK